MHALYERQRPDPNPMYCRDFRPNSGAASARSVVTTYLPTLLRHLPRRRHCHFGLGSGPAAMPSLNLTPTCLPQYGVLVRVSAPFPSHSLSYYTLLHPPPSLRLFAGLAHEVIPRLLYRMIGWLDFWYITTLSLVLFNIRSHVVSLCHSGGFPAYR
jgi:hypothetical protein